MGTSRQVAALVVICACGTGDTKIDPGALELRDLLGIAPEVTYSWDADQRAAARHVLIANLDASAKYPLAPSLDAASATSLDLRVLRSLTTLDVQRAAAGDDALGLVRIELVGADAPSAIAPLTAMALAGPRASSAFETVTASTTARDAAARTADPSHSAALDIAIGDGIDALSPEAIDVVSAFARDAGHRDGRVIIVGIPRLPVIAGYVAGSAPHLLVNPVALAAVSGGTVTAPGTTTTTTPATPSETTARIASDRYHDDKTSSITSVAQTGNPYSFYGSVAECAYAQRLRCEGCLPSSSCNSITSAGDGNAECTMFAANSGRGYFLECINLALAITSVDRCTADSVSQCPRVTDAASNLSQLEANASFLDDTSCSSGLDTCLAKIYGPPSGEFPGPVDGGTSSTPPRSTNVSCGDSCSNNNCSASPNASCSGPSCNNSLSCDSTCASSNSGGGCGTCSDTSGGGGGGGGSCGGDSGGGGGGSCGSSGGSSGGSCGGSSGDCGSCGSSGGSSGGSCGGGDCGGGSCGGGSCGGDCGGSSCGGSGGCGNSSCQVARKTPSAGFAIAMSIGWALLPVPLAARARRRSKKRKARDRDSVADEARTDEVNQ